MPAAAGLLVIGLTALLSTTVIGSNASVDPGKAPGATVARMLPHAVHEAPSPGFIVSQDRHRQPGSGPPTGDATPLIRPREHEAHAEEFGLFSDPQDGQSHSAIKPTS